MPDVTESNANRLAIFLDRNDRTIATTKTIDPIATTKTIDDETIDPIATTKTIEPLLSIFLFSGTNQHTQKHTTHTMRAGLRSGHALEQAVGATPRTDQRYQHAQKHTSNTMRAGLRSGNNALEQAAADFANGSPTRVSSVKSPPSQFLSFSDFVFCFPLRQNTPGTYFASIDPSDVERSPENVSLINPFLFRDGRLILVFSFGSVAKEPTT